MARRLVEPTSTAQPTTADRKNLWQKLAGGAEKVAEFAAPRTMQVGKEMVSGDETWEKKDVWDKYVMPVYMARRAKELAPMAGEIGAYMLPASLEVTGSPLLNRVVGGAAGGGLLGATSPEEMTTGERVGRTATGAVAGGAIAGTLYGIGKGISWLASWPKKTKEQMANQLLGQTPSQVKVDKEGANWLSKKVVSKLDDGTLQPGNYADLQNQSQVLLNQTEQQIQDIMSKKGTTATIKTTKLLSGIDDLASQASKAGDSAKARALSRFKEEVLSQWGETINASQALDLKRVMDHALSESAFSKSASEIAASKAAGQRAVGDTTRKWLKQAIPGVGDLLEDQSVYINLSGAIERQLQKSGTAPIKGGSIGGLSPLNLFGRALTYPITQPKVLTEGISRVGSGQVPQKASDLITNPFLQKLLVTQTGRF